MHLSKINKIYETNNREERMTTREKEEKTQN